jgi:hypothetical protein
MLAKVFIWSLWYLPYQSLCSLSLACTFFHKLRASHRCLQGSSRSLYSKLSSSSIIWTGMQRRQLKTWSNHPCKPVGTGQVQYRHLLHSSASASKTCTLIAVHQRTFERLDKLHTSLWRYYNGSWPNKRLQFWKKFHFSALRRRTRDPYQRRQMCLCCWVQLLCSNLFE